MSGAQVAALLWCLVVAATLAFDLGATMLAVATRRDLKRRRANGLRALVARAAVRRQVGRVAVQALFLAIGLLALVSPRPGRSDAAGVVLTLALIATEALLAATTVVDRIEHERLLAGLEYHEERHG